MPPSFLGEDPLIERLAPELDPLATPFWTGGADGSRDEVHYLVFVPAPAGSPSS